MPDEHEGLRLAAEQGDPEAMFELAEVLRQEWNRPGRPEQFEPLYRRAVASGHLGAMRELGGWLVGTGYLGPDREPEGRALIAQAADLGDTMAMMLMGHLLRREGDEVEGHAWFRRASELGNLNATAFIGDLHLAAGQLAEAETWLREAVEKGNDRAIPRLANALIGQGRHAEVESWYQLGVERGDVASMVFLRDLRREAGRSDEAEDLSRRIDAALGGPRPRPTQRSGVRTTEFGPNRRVTVRIEVIGERSGNSRLRPVHRDVDYRVVTPLSEQRAIGLAIGRFERDEPDSVWQEIEIVQVESDFTWGDDELIDRYASPR